MEFKKLKVALMYSFSTGKQVKVKKNHNFVKIPGLDFREFDPAAVGQHNIFFCLSDLSRYMSMKTHPSRI